ncbi:alpha/beta fold hydrolase [Streptomyces polygonati]|uniref:Alpha/beta fold hydrolase n=1 Tax=Streptomyces polygonati TaxID=1617087 RepID=A0ABV8HI00_9ACTN
MTDTTAVRAGRHLRPRKRVVIPAMLAVAVLAIPAASTAASAAATASTTSATHAVTPRAHAGSGTRGSHGPKPTVVLVHGAFADSSGWNGVITRLVRDGYPVIAPADPLRDLTTDAAYISSVLDTIPGPVVLVGHSYGGEVITNAAVGHANVRALVYIAAFAPEQGESALALTGEFPGSQLGANILTRPFPTAEGGTGVDAYVDPAHFREVFAGDLPASTTRLMAATQRPVTLAALSTPSGVPAWKTIPSWYLVAGSDQAIPAAAERLMAKRAGARTVEIKGASHVVMISHPGRTADLITAAADATT